MSQYALSSCLDQVHTRSSTPVEAFIRVLIERGWFGAQNTGYAHSGKALPNVWPSKAFLLLRGVHKAKSRGRILQAGGPVPYLVLQILPGLVHREGASERLVNNSDLPRASLIVLLPNSSALRGHIRRD